MNINSKETIKPTGAPSATQSNYSPPYREGPGGGSGGSAGSHVVIELHNVRRHFQVGSETVKALRGVSFKIYEGEFVTIQGTSGSGKSTLLNQLCCLDTPTPHHLPPL